MATRCNVCKVDIDDSNISGHRSWHRDVDDVIRDQKRQIRDLEDKVRRLERA